MEAASFKIHLLIHIKMLNRYFFVKRSSNLFFISGICHVFAYVIEYVEAFLFIPCTS